MTRQSNNSQRRRHDRLPNWNPKNSGMLISQPVDSCLTNHSELCMSRLRNNQSRRISIYRLQRRPSFGFESSVSSTSMTSGDPVIVTSYASASILVGWMVGTHCLFMERCSQDHISRINNVLLYKWFCIHLPLFKYKHRINYWLHFYTALLYNWHLVHFQHSI